MVRRFSFAHRRFNEYFVACWFMKNPDTVQMEAIPEDSRKRGALVLYCEVADEDKAREIAEFCWSELSPYMDSKIEIWDPSYSRIIHTMRFLRQAFITRKQSLSTFFSDLSLYITNKFPQSYYPSPMPLDILVLKHTAELLGFLEEKDFESTLIQVIKIKNKWIIDTALNSCRHMSSMGVETMENLNSFFSGMNSFRFMREFKHLNFSLKFADGFKNVRKFFHFRMINILTSIIALILIMLIYPNTALVVFLIVGVLLLVLMILQKFNIIHVESIDIYSSCFEILRVVCILSILLVLYLQVSLYRILNQNDWEMFKIIWLIFGYYEAQELILLQVHFCQY